MIKPITPITTAKTRPKPRVKYAMIPGANWKVPVPEDLDTDFITVSKPQPLVLKHYVKFEEFKIKSQNQHELIICKCWRGPVESVLDEVFQDYQWSDVKYDQVTVFIKAGHNEESITALKSVCEGILYYQENQPVFVEGTKSDEIVRDDTEHKESDIQYNVDPNELIDIPNRMKSQIVKQLIKFRSRVINEERQRRNDNIMKERIKVRERIFQTHKIEKLGSKYKEPIDDGISEHDYRQQLKSQESSRLEKAFVEKLRHFNAIKDRKKVLKLALERAKNYEDDVMNKKEKFMGFIGTVDRLNKQHEQELDDINRSKDVQEPVEDINVKDTSKLSIESLSKLNDFIEKLMEKYMGMVDDEMVKYLFNSMLENNLNHKDLVETLDEDATKFVQELNEFIDQHSK